VLSHPPRNPEEPILQPADLKRTVFESAVLSASALGAYAYGLMRYGLGPQASTMAFMTLTGGQLLHALSCRSDRLGVFDAERLPPNNVLNLALLGSFGVQAMALLTPGLRQLLGLAPIGLLDTLAIGGGALLSFVVNESTKAIAAPRESTDGARAGEPRVNASRHG
jgi:Ca2+-transporting ATPase